MKYRKKIEYVEAMLFTLETSADVARWCHGRLMSEAKPGDPTDVATWIEVPGFGDSERRAWPGNYVVATENDGFYPMRADIFEQLYEASEGREGLVTVYDHEGRFLGCMGVNAWSRASTEAHRGTE